LSDPPLRHRAASRVPELNFSDDKEGKPVGIHSHIGRRPVMAFGTSDGDFKMLEWTTAGSGPWIRTIKASAKNSQILADIENQGPPLS
jgi:hypothetical protein